MKRTVLLLFTVFAVCALVLTERVSAQGKTNALDQLVTCTVTASNGLTMGIILGSGTNITSEQQVFFVFRLPTGKAAVFPLADEYLMDISLLDSQGRPATKTKIGKRFHLADSVSWSVGHLRAVSYNSSMRVDVSQGWSEPMLQIPEIRDLFTIDKPGRYTLTIRMQVFVASDGKINLVRFPKAEVTLEL